MELYRCPKCGRGFTVPLEDVVCVLCGGKVKEPPRGRSEYSRIQDTFNAAKADCSEKLTLAEKERRRIVSSDWRWFAFGLATWVAGVGIAAACIFLVVLLSLWGLLLDFALVSAAHQEYKRQRQRVEAAIVGTLREKLAPSDALAAAAKAAFSAAYRRYEHECTYVRGYPPDWNERRDAVKKRDGYRCTNCGWPTGFLRLRRELHVHHIVPVAEGGDNSLENLVTLCHMCHRNVGKYHHSVRRLNRPRRRR